MAITKIPIGDYCLMCDDPLPKGKIFVCRGECEDMSGVNDMKYPSYLPLEQLRQLIAKRVVARRKYIESRNYHVMMDTRDFIKGLKEI